MGRFKPPKVEQSKRIQLAARDGHEYRHGIGMAIAKIYKILDEKTFSENSLDI